MRNLELRQFNDIQEHRVDSFTDLIDDLVDTLFYDAVADFSVTDEDDEDAEAAKERAERIAFATPHEYWGY